MSGKRIALTMLFTLVFVVIIVWGYQDIRRYDAVRNACLEKGYTYHERIFGHDWCIKVVDDGSLYGVLANE